MGDTKLTTTATVIAAVVITAWLSVLGFMLTRIEDEGELVWTRLGVVLGSIEAVAFAAAGALFGVTVQKQRVEDANKRADKHEDAAMKGKALATAIRAHVSSSAANSDSQPDTVRHEQLPAHVVAMADQLFPWEHSR